MTEISDEQIIRSCSSEKTLNAGFELLVNKYQQRIYWLIRRMVIRHEDADDLVQEVFIRIFKNLPKFRQESELFTWIYRITVNEVISFLNRQKRKKLLSLESYDHVLEGAFQNDPYFTGDEIQKKLQQALLKLPAKQRLVFQMKYYDAITYEKMSDILGTSVGALKASYHHAVRKIEQLVLDH